jgi:hypothetical protein
VGCRQFRVLRWVGRQVGGGYQGIPFGDVRPFLNADSLQASTVSLPTVARDTRASTFGHEIPETEFPSDFLQLAAIFSWKRKSRFINAGFNEVVVNEATVEVSCIVQRATCTSFDKPPSRPWRNAGLAPQIVRSLGYHQPSSGAFLQITTLPLLTLLERAKAFETEPGAVLESLIFPYKSGTAGSEVSTACSL